MKSLRVVFVCTLMVLALLAFTTISTEARKHPRPPQTHIPINANPSPPSPSTSSSSSSSSSASSLFRPHPRSPPSSSSVRSPAASVFNVRSFGAKGDNFTVRRIFFIPHVSQPSFHIINHFHIHVSRHELFCFVVLIISLPHVFIQH